MLLPLALRATTLLFAQVLLPFPWLSPEWVTRNGCYVYYGATLLGMLLGYLRATSISHSTPVPSPRLLSPTRLGARPQQQVERPATAALLGVGDRGEGRQVEEREDGVRGGLLVVVASSFLVSKSVSKYKRRSHHLRAASSPFIMHTHMPQCL